MRRKSGASNATGLLNMLGPNEINEDLQKMNDAQLDGDDNDEEHKNYKDEEEKEEGTNAAEVDDEMLEETDQNKKRKAKDDNSTKKRKATQPLKKLPTRGRKVGV